VNPTLVRKALYPLYRALRRDDVLWHLAEMRRVQVMDGEQIREYQWRKLKKLLDYAHGHVPYYRDLFARLGAHPQDIKTGKDFERLPVLRKRDITENPQALIPEDYPKRHLRPDSTGGSTGENLYFYVGREAEDARKANDVRMNEWNDIQIGEKMALLWGTAFDVEKSRRLANALRSWLSNRLLLSAYRMDEHSLGDYVKRLKRFRPDVMVGYPSAMAHFSQSIIGAGVDALRPRAVILSGETLYDWQREVIEKAFGAKVYNHYGCREFGAMARECRLRDGLHICCERVLFETVRASAGGGGDDGGSELLVTDLDSYGMPFIRYAIKDMGAITWDRCECGLGLPRLTRTIGRTFDVVRAPNGNYLGGTFWTILLRKKKGIHRFQVIQQKLDEITIAIIPTGDFSDETRRYILDKVREACGPDMRVRFELKPNLETTPTGKHRFVISRLEQGHSGGKETRES
jgi:phenylacetate-CoA ligase